MIRRLHVKVVILIVLFSPFLFTAKAEAYEEPVAGISVVLEHYQENQDKKIYDLPLSADLQFYTLNLCFKYDVEFELVLAVMDGESDFDFDTLATNRNGTTDHGVMQINSCNLKWLKEELGITDFLDPKQNILCGVFMLSELSAKYENVNQILISYNMGESNMHKLKRKGIYTTEYSRKIVRKMNKLKGDESG